VSPRLSFGQDEVVLQELDAYWATVSHDIETGNYEGSTLAYHPDAVWEEGSNGKLRTMLESDALPGSKAVLDRVKSGELKVGLEFRFSSRIHNHNTAHEIGVVHMWVQESGGPAEHNYWKLDTYLVKKDRWMAIVEIQTERLTVNEWNALAPTE
jgi:hypothetical protein